MKPRSAFFTSAFLKAAPAFIVIALTSGVSQAASKYWDLNGTTAGLGAGAGTWDLSAANWNTATAGTAATVAFASGDDAFFQTAGVNTVTLGANLTANSITQTTSSTATTVSTGAGTQITLTTGNLNNTGNQPFTLNPNLVLGASGTINTTNTITLGGVLSDGGGGFGFTKAGTSSLTLNGANTYTGTTNVTAGTVSVAGATANINSSSTITLGGIGLTATLSLDNTAGIVNRLKDTAPVSLSAGGALSLVGNAANTTETIGALSLGSGGSSITISGTAAGLLHTLSAASITRTNLGTGLMRGSSLGQQATNATLLTLSDTSGLNFVGTTTANGTSPGSAKDVKIVPWLIGDSSATSAGVNFVTYDTTGGLRPLGSNEYVTLNAGYAGSGENVKGFNGTITAASPSLNSLLFTAANALDGSGTLSVASGAVALINSNIASIGSGFSSLSLGNNEGVISVTSSGSLTINAPVNVTGGGGLTKAGGGSGALVLNAANSYTGATTVNQGFLTIGSTGSTTASSAVTIKPGGVFTVNSGGTANGSVTAQISTTQTTANVINSGTIVGTLTTSAGTGPASPNANATPIVSTGHAQLNPGSSTGSITNNGQLTFSGAAPITPIGTISGSGGNGGFNDANTDTKTLTLAAGSSFSYFRPTNTSGTATSILQVVGNGTTAFQWFGYNNTVGGTADVTFNGGTFNIGKIGQNNSGATTIGNYTVTNGSVLNIAVGGYDHGTWNIINGTMAFTGGITGNNGLTGTAASLQFTVNNSGGGTGSTLSATGSLTLGSSVASSSQNNFLTIGNGGTASFTAGLLSVGSSAAATAETNTVNLNGGKLLVGGATGIVAGTGTGQTKTFNWTGGRLSALQITPGVNFTNPVSGGITNTGLVNSGGVLAPGDVGTAGRTTITGDYAQQAGGTLAIDIAGTNQTGSFQQTVTPSYDNVLLSGATANISLNGNLQVSLVGFTPDNSNTFTIVRAAPSTLAVTGAFSNVAFGARITTQGAEGSFLLTNTDGVITLSDYQPSSGNTPPTITAISDLSIPSGSNTGPLAFTVGDVETPAASLTLSGSSSNVTLVPNSNIVFGGSGASRTVTVTPVSGLTGTATITVNVSDGALSTPETFILTVSGNYTSWATVNGIPGQPASGDFDNDGLSNLTEYALGKNPTVSSQPPGTLSGGVVTYTKGADAIANGDVSWIIEQSINLTTWAPVVTQAAADPALTISYTLPPGQPKEFARLKAVKQP